MANLDKIVGGSINSWGGIDVNYRPSGFSVERGGVIRERYTDTGCRIGGDGLIRDGYNMPTGLSLNRFGNITRNY